MKPEDLKKEIRDLYVEPTNDKKSIKKLAQQIVVLDKQISKQNYRMSVLLKKLEEYENQNKNLTLLLEEMFYFLTEVNSSPNIPTDKTTTNVLDPILQLREEKLVKFN